MRNEFSAVLERDGDWYLAYALEIPGANGQGRTRDEALESLREAVTLILEDRRDDAVEGAAAGEKIGIANAGPPLARLEASESRSVSRCPGAWTGQVWVGEDFDAPLPPEMAVGFGVDEEE